MLTISIPPKEMFNNKTGKFSQLPGGVIKLEHSLVSISKWERLYKKAYISTKEKTFKETIDYIKCMTINQNVDEKLYENIGTKELKIIEEYINDPYCATVIHTPKSNNVIGGSKTETVTAELIYYWMISYQIPMDCQKWHINRLIMLIRVFHLKNSNGKSKNKMSQRDLMKNNDALNAQRHAEAKARSAKK